MSSTSDRTTLRLKTERAGSNNGNGATRDQFGSRVAHQRG